MSVGEALDPTGVEAPFHIGRRHCPGAGPASVLTRIVLPSAATLSVNVPAAADLVPGEARDCEDRADHHRDHAEDPDDVYRGNETDDEEDYSQQDHGVTP